MNTRKPLTAVELKLLRNAATGAWTATVELDAALLLRLLDDLDAAYAEAWDARAEVT